MSMFSWWQSFLLAFCRQDASHLGILLLPLCISCLLNYHMLPLSSLDNQTLPSEAYFRIDKPKLLTKDVRVKSLDYE